MSKNSFLVSVRLSTEQKTALQKMGASSDSEALRVLIDQHIQGETIEQRISQAIGPLSEKLDSIEAEMRDAVYQEVKTVLDAMTEEM